MLLFFKAAQQATELLLPLLTWPRAVGLLAAPRSSQEAVPTLFPLLPLARLLAITTAQHPQSACSSLDVCQKRRQEAGDGGQSRTTAGLPSPGLG